MLNNSITAKTFAMILSIRTLRTVLYIKNATTVQMAATLVIIVIIVLLASLRSI